MTDTKTATVEVLTAEVRVLMVGSRQITLSVFKQLDEVSHQECIPMGRVNAEIRGGDLWIVGKDKKGNLIRSQWRSGWDNYISLPLIVLAGLK